MNNNNILRSAYISLLIQFLIGLVSIHGILIPLSSKDDILNDIMMLELIVQFIEFSFYVWLVIQLSKMSFEVTYTRYFDWFISTPLMLLTTAYFMEYLNTVNTEKIANIATITYEKSKEIITMLVANFVMLLTGFLGELNIMNRYVSFGIGTIALCVSFYTLFHTFVGNNFMNKGLFYFMFTVWSFYGIAFLFPYVLKNTFYNYLDILSKNFYGLFIYFFILKTANYI